MRARLGQPEIAARAALLLATAALTAATQAPATPIAPDAFAPGPGQPQTVRACTACHSASLVTGERRTAAQWARLVDRMIANGAQVPNTDYPAIIDYLARTYPAAP